MYSLVLMMALSNNAAVPTLSPEELMAGQRVGSQEVYRCHGCCGCHGCHSSCHGCHRGHRCHGCHGCHGCCSYSSCCSSSWGCCGGSWGCHGAIVTCCAYGAPMPPAPPAWAPPAKKNAEEVPPAKKAEEGKEEVAAPATIQVSLPADAKLLVDEAPTTSTSASRSFVSPPLQPGKEFYYTLKAVVVRDGKTVTETKVVQVKAGATSRVILGLESANQVVQK